MVTTDSMLLFRNLRLLDPRFDEARGGYEVLVEGDRIREVSDGLIRSEGAAVVDCGGRVLMPGLIDCHVHCMHSDVYMRRLEDVTLTLATARGAVRLRSMLNRGLTTVRHPGGPDWGVQHGRAACSGHVCPSVTVYVVAHS